MKPYLLRTLQTYTAKAESAYTKKHENSSRLLCKISAKFEHAKRFIAAEPLGFQQLCM